MAMFDVPLALLLETCAPQVSPVTMAAIVAQESGGDALVIHDNRTAKTLRLQSLAQAVAIAQRLIDAGDSLDLGLAQINSANLLTLGLNVEAVFEPCTNLHTAQTLLLEDWKRSGGDLRATLAAYHTGCSTRCAPVKEVLGAAYSAGIYARARVDRRFLQTGRVPLAMVCCLYTNPLTPRSGDLSVKSTRLAPREMTMR